MSENPSVVALIPARAGSKRVRDKNVRLLDGHPLLGYSIAAAADSALFSSIIVSTDEERIAGIARYYGAEVPFLRPSELAGDASLDIEWVEYTLQQLQAEGREFDCFSILRPTSPFRHATTIQRAWKQFLERDGADSLRAVERCKQHPAKMWMVSEDRMRPLLDHDSETTPSHSTPYQSLPEVYVQNASLEIAWSRVVFEERTISGEVLVPFLTKGYEGFDINDENDLVLAEHLIRSGEAKLPSVSRSPLRPTPSP